MYVIKFILTGFNTLSLSERSVTRERCVLFQSSFRISGGFWPKIENKQPDTRNSQQKFRRLMLLNMNPSILTDDAVTTTPTSPKQGSIGGVTR